MDGHSLGLTEFFGIRVPPRKHVEIGCAPGPSDDSLDTIHLSQVALGPDAQKGRHVVWVDFDGTKSVIGSLTLGGIEQFQIDFPVNRELKISHSGSSDVYLTGYTTHQFLTLEDDSTSDGGESDSEDEEAQDNGRIRRSGGRLIQLPEDGDYDEPDYVDGQAAEEDSEDEDDEEMEDSDSETGEDEVAVPSAKSRVKSKTFDMDDDEDDTTPGFLPLADSPSGGLHPPMDSDESDDSESGSEYETDEEAIEEEAPTQLKSSSKESKRKAAAAPASEVKDAKKAKAKKPTAAITEAAVSTPKTKSKGPATTTPSKDVATPSAAGVLADYQNSLNSFLRSNGPTKMAVIGTEVKRVSGLPKLGKFVKDRQDMYALDEMTGILSLKD